VLKSISVALLLLVAAAPVAGHDPGAPPPTWNREISRIVFARCAACHRPGGTSFSLLTYSDAQPRAAAIKAAVLSRQMPPWGAVKGFGDFRNDQGLTQEQMSLIADWVGGNAPKGNNPNALPPVPSFGVRGQDEMPAGGIMVTGEQTLDHSFTLDGLFPDRVPRGTTMQIVAVRPGGAIEPLLWLYAYRDSDRHPFLFRHAIRLEAGTIVRGVPRDASVRLLLKTEEKKADR